MASAGCPQVSVRFRQPSRVGLGGRYTSVLTNSRVISLFLCMISKEMMSNLYMLSLRVLHEVL